MKSIQKDRKKTTVIRKIGKENAESSKREYGPNIEEIKKFEPLVPSRDFSDIDIEKYNYILNLADRLYDYMVNKHPHSCRYQYYSFFQKYEDILRLTRTFKNREYIIMNGIKCNLTSESEIDLLIVLYTDSTLKYGELYKQYKENNLDTKQIQDKLTYKFGFFSYKLIYMELKTEALRLKLENEHIKSR